MSAATAIAAAPTSSLTYFRSTNNNYNGDLFYKTFFPRRTCFYKPLSNQTFFRNPVRVSKRKSNRSSNGHVRPYPTMEWQDCSVQMEVDVPCSVAYNFYADREAMPRWMPFISSVEILKDKPDQSRWTLRYEAFGRNLEFSWLARNMQPIPNQKIHWRSLDGLPNRGAVRFYPKGPSSCIVDLTVSYEVPPILAGVASALNPFLKSLLLRGLEKFATYAKSYQTDLPQV